MNMWEEMKDEGQKWVCTLKETPNGVIPKFTRGFEESNIQELPKDSTACASES